MAKRRKFKMVNVMNKQIWKCPYCEETYEIYDDAKTCANNCAEVDEPEEDYDEIFECEMCSKVFEDYDDTEACEMKHIDNKDKHWERFEEIQSKKRLMEAASHSEQTKIINFK